MKEWRREIPKLHPQIEEVESTIKEFETMRDMVPGRKEMLEVISPSFSP